ncbi:hypothetical protein ElyMa_001627900 [Elysia marginata]|uniref:Uncharacterized protein n=1 Tax=Elysia marginata TaxID=1093978 RepID=A0AAV4JKL5_9GAST|nr:hypothetical protein ElyMa_001627900 [Elysia marginata]
MEPLLKKTRPLLLRQVLVRFDSTGHQPPHTVSQPAHLAGLLGTRYLAGEKTDGFSVPSTKIMTPQMEIRTRGLELRKMENGRRLCTGNHTHH